MDELTDELLAVISGLPVATSNRLPQIVKGAWPAMVLISLRNARARRRDPLR